MSLSLPEDYRPDDYFDEDHGGSENETERLFSTFTVLTAFSLIAVIPIFPVSAMETGVIDGNVVVNGTVYPGLTVAEAMQLEGEMILMDAAAQAGTTIPRMSTQMSALLTRSATARVAQGESMFEADVAALAALDAYNVPPQNSSDHRRMGHYLGGTIGGGGNGAGSFGNESGPGGLGGGPGSGYGGGPGGGFFGGPGPGPGVNPGGGGSPGTGPPDGGAPGYGGPTPPGINPEHSPPWDDAGSSGGSCFDGQIFDYCLRLM